MNLGAKIRVALRARGPGFHTDDCGSSAVSLGFEISPGRFGVRLTRAKLFQTAGALEELLWAGWASCREVEARLGSYGWPQLVTRCSLSIWRNVYQLGSTGSQPSGTMANSTRTRRGGQGCLHQ